MNRKLQIIISAATLFAAAFAMPPQPHAAAQPDSETEFFVTAEIDSAAYQQMMDLGIKARAEKNRSHAIAYFKEAFHINPYSIDPLEQIVDMNNEDGNQSDNYAVYEYGVNELSSWNRAYGTGAGAIFPMEWLTDQMRAIYPDDIYPQFALVWTYLQAPTEILRGRADRLMDQLIPQAEKREMWDQYGYMMTLKTFFAKDEDSLIDLYEPNAEKLARSPQGAGALVVLSRIYTENKGDAGKGARFMRLAEMADPQKTEIAKWIDK